jgi:hypothetical protein
MRENLSYGIGGFDPQMPHDNLIERLVDNEDGTGVHTDYRTDPPTVTNLTGLPIPEPEPPTLDEVFADVPVQTLEEANAVLVNLQAALQQRGII